MFEFVPVTQTSIFYFIFQKGTDSEPSRISNGSSTVVSKVSPWLVSSEVISAPVTQANTNDISVIRKSVITTQL